MFEDNLIKDIINKLNTPQQKLILLTGIPCSGKTTLTKSLTNFTIVSTDSLREKFAREIPGNEGKYASQMEAYLFQNESHVWASAFKTTKEELNQGNSVVFDATLLNPKQRSRVISLAKYNNIEIISIVIDCPLELALQRNKIRATTPVGYNNSFPIMGIELEEDYIINSFNKMECPQYEEGFTEIYIIDP